MARRNGWISRDLQLLLKRAEEQGATVTRTANGHCLVRPADPDQDIVTVAPKDGDPRALDNVRRDLRRSGFDVSKGQKGKGGRGRG